MSPKPLKIDFVSDVVCPWCAVGLGALQQALERIGAELSTELHFQPFELNPDMPPEGEDAGEHIARKYGASAEQMAQNQATIRERGAAVGFTFNLDRRQRIYNTFDAHRLLHWAGLEGRQAELKRVLLEAYFSQGLDVSDQAVLVEAARLAGLDPARAGDILRGQAYAEDVRQREAFYRQQGISSVPSIIVNDRWLIQGGQPPEVFEQSLRQIASEAAGTA